MRDAYTDQLDSIRDDLVTMARLVREAVVRGHRGPARGRRPARRAGDQRRRRRSTPCARRSRSTASSCSRCRTRSPATCGCWSRRCGWSASSSGWATSPCTSPRSPGCGCPRSPCPTRVVPTIARMAAVAEVMIGKVEHVIADSDVAAAEELEEVDQEMDQLRRNSFRELLGSDWKHGVEPAVDIALLGRYYERIADHAVSIARRVVFLVTGEHPQYRRPELRAETAPSRRTRASGSPHRPRRRTPPARARCRRSPRRAAGARRLRRASR